MTDSSWTVQILTSTPMPSVSGGIERRDGAFRPHSEPGPSLRGNQVVEASVETLKANWHETVKQLTEIGDGIDDGQSKWGVSEIEVGLTLSAKGQLLFIAEAGAEASVKIKLSRRS